MKKRLILALILSLSLLVVACDGKEDLGTAESGVVSSTAGSFIPINSTTGSEGSAATASDVAGDSQAVTMAPDTVMATAFRVLEKDMSYAEVERPFDCAEATDITKGSYNWTNRDDVGIITITFENDHLTSYSQVDVIVDKSAKATMDAYNRLKPEMSYNETKGLLDGDDVPVSAGYIADQAISSYTWIDSDGLPFTLAFSNGKLSATNTDRSQ